MTLDQGGVSGASRRAAATLIPVITDLPCCFEIIDNQPNGMIFGQDGYLVHGRRVIERHDREPAAFATRLQGIVKYEASILRIQPHTGEITTIANGIRNPYDLASDSSGQLYATDNGLLTGRATAF